MTIEWSAGDDLSIFVSMQEAPTGLSGIGLTEDELVRIDMEQSIDSYIDHEDERYFYSNSLVFIHPWWYIFKIASTIYICKFFWNNESMHNLYIV